MGEFPLQDCYRQRNKQGSFFTSAIILPQSCRVELEEWSWRDECSVVLTNASYLKKSFGVISTILFCFIDQV